MMAYVVWLLLSVVISGCAVDVSEIGREPRLSPVGTGLDPTLVSMPVQPTINDGYGGDHSLWQDASADLFRDARAMKVGDVVTVNISIKDRASIDNSSDRSRDSEGELGGSLAYDIAAWGKQVSGTASGNTKFDSKTSTKGKGAIARSEKIDLLIAAVVTDVMPNGNLIISGKQEVRVNFEVRILSVAGIVRPRDISTDNSVSYDRIAEARISYGGRGRIMEVQQPAWGHQILDVLSPL